MTHYKNALAESTLKKINAFVSALENGAIKIDDTLDVPDFANHTYSSNYLLVQICEIMSTYSTIINF